LNTQNHLVDANFTTFTTNGELSDHQLLALLNSGWCQALLEATGTPLGGGALKVEAAHWRSIPIPRLEPAETYELGRLGRSLGHGQKVFEQIDDVLVEAASRALGLESSAVRQQLAAVQRGYRSRRNRAA
jgi:hypothetical protein